MTLGVLAALAAAVVIAAWQSRSPRRRDVGRDPPASPGAPRPVRPPEEVDR